MDNNANIFPEEKQREFLETNHYNITNFHKRCITLDYQKKAFSYLFSKESDWLIVDLAEIRTPLLHLSNGTTVTRPPILNDKLLSELYGEYSEEKVNRNSCDWEKMCSVICDQIKEHYNGKQVIFIDLRCADHAINEREEVYELSPWWGVDGAWGISFVNSLLEICSEYFIKNIPEAHIIRLPKPLLADVKNKWGVYPLYYSQLYYDYLYKAVTLITERKENETELLDELLDRFSMKAEMLKFNLESCTEKRYLREQISDIACTLSSSLAHKDSKKLLVDLLKKQTDTLTYLKMLNSVKREFLILMVVKDTAGNRVSDGIVEEIRSIGFSEFTRTEHIAFAGICSHGDAVFNKNGSSVVEKTEHCGAKIHLESRSFSDGNCSKIIIDGSDYSINMRGVNIVVFDTENHIVVDSVAFDHHFSVHDIVRKTLESQVVKAPIEDKIDLIRKGYDLACRYVDGNQNVHYMIKSHHIGDAMRTLPLVSVYKRYYSAENQINDTSSLNKKVSKIVVITTSVLAGVARLFRDIDEIIVLSRDEVSAIDYYAQSGMNFHKNLFPDENSMNNHNKETMFGVSNQNWLLDLPMKVEHEYEIRRNSKSVSDYSVDQAKKFLSENKVTADKMAIICPYSQSSTSLTQNDVDKVIRFLKDNEYKVYTNVGPKEKELSGTYRLQIPVDTLCALGIMGAYIIGAQSGLVDTLRWLDADINMLIVSFFFTNTDKLYARNRRIVEPVECRGTTTYLLADKKQELSSLPDRIIEQSSLIIRGRQQKCGMTSDAYPSAATDLNGYIHDIAGNKDLVLLMSVYDSADVYWNQAMISLSELGLKADISGKWRMSYTAVVDIASGYVSEKSGDTVQGVEDYYFFGDSNSINKAYVLSCGMDSQRYTRSLIMINGVNYSMRKRGLNIVAFSKKSNCVVDSVNVDLFGDDKMLVVRKS